MPSCTKCGAELDLAKGLSCPSCKTTVNPLSLESVLSQRAEPGKRIFPRFFIGVGGILVIIIILAESGAVSSETSETKWNAEGKNESEYSTAGRQAPLRGVGFAPTVVVGFPPGEGHDLAKEAAAAMKKAGSSGGSMGQSKLEITITQVKPEGASWLPFHKSGSCTFVATYTLAAQTPWSSFAGRGQVSGSVTQTMNGLCSTGLFREKMGQAIAAAILSDISKLVAKYS